MSLLKDSNYLTRLGKFTAGLHSAKASLHFQALFTPWDWVRPDLRSIGGHGIDLCVKQAFGYFYKRVWFKAINKAPLDGAQNFARNQIYRLVLCAGGERKDRVA